MELGKFIPVLCILLGLTKPSVGVDRDCYYKQHVNPDATYYVYNPAYPSYYIGEHSCLWHATSDTRIKLSCDIFNVPASPNCSRDALIVQTQDDVEYTLCGLSSFTVESVSNEMAIKFRSPKNSLGGRFKCELKAIEPQCSCGWRNPSRIVNGVETGVNEYPMMAGLVSISIRLLFCGGTIISPKHILTAAHCVTSYVDKTNDLAIVVGEHDIKRGDDTNATQIYLAESFIIHPQYDSEVKDFDVAIVKSTSSFVYSMRVGPVCLPFNYKGKNLTGDIVTALGWGLTNFNGKKSSKLMKVNLNVIDLRKCAEYYNVTENQICTYTRKKDSCQYDSGGPLLWQNPQTNRIMLMGIINYGEICAEEAPGVNARVTCILDFIVETIKDYLFCKTY